LVNITKDIMTQADNEAYGTKPPELIDSRVGRVWAIGNRQLLNNKSVGICGSRSASERGMEVALDCADQFASHDVVVIAGYAAGIDMVAHRAALAAGGKTIIVLPEGISHFRIRRDIQDVWDWTRALVISPFDLEVRWQVWRAMKRNEYIVGLSMVMIVVEAGEKGGTLHAGKTALSTNTPLFVCNYKESSSAQGNVLLLKTGGIPLNQSEAHGRAKLDKVFELIEERYKIKKDGAGQFLLL
jgi:DNA processing protein